MDQKYYEYILSLGKRKNENIILLIRQGGGYSIENYKCVEILTISSCPPSVLVSCPVLDLVLSFVLDPILNSSMVNTKFLNP